MARLRKCLDELRSLISPPQGVKEVMVALWKVVNSSEGKDVKGMKVNWGGVHKSMNSKFWLRVQGIDVAKVETAVWTEVRRVLSQGGVDAMMKKSVAAGGVARYL